MRRIVHTCASRAPSQWAKSRLPMHIHGQPRKQTWCIPAFMTMDTIAGQCLPPPAMQSGHSREPDAIGDKAYTNKCSYAALGPCNVEEKVRIPEERRCNNCCSSLRTPKPCLSLVVTCQVLRQHLCSRTLREQAYEELPPYRKVLQYSRRPLLLALSRT